MLISWFMSVCSLLLKEALINILFKIFAEEKTVLLSVTRREVV
ncbi:hypothetical protein GGR08_000772 [Bartonella fuyuanensis]|uniref:Uncharacterized protein n=1 Tax=Bartonella fuyuanensis TaxID=1460968 RepID=A0A840DY76_9HYPH|nr:hypothetical protein [Bartonella fuyuanensis]